MGTLLEQTKIPLKLVFEKIWSRRTKSTLEKSRKFQSLQIWSQQKKQYSDEKLQNQSISGQNSFGIPFQTFLQDCSARKLQPETWPSDEKVSFQLTMQLFSPTMRKWKEAASIFLHLCLNNFWAPGPRDLCILKKSSFFLISAAQKHISLLGRTTIDRLLNITVNGVEQQKHKNFKKWRTDWLVSRSNHRNVSSLLAGKLARKTPNYRKKCASEW